MDEQLPKPPPTWTSANYAVREIPAKPMKPVQAGFCWFNATCLPRSCTWCGRPMHLEVYAKDQIPVVVCDVCDMRGVWP